MNRHIVWRLVIVIAVWSSLSVADEPTAATKPWRVRATHLAHGWRCRDAVFSPDGRWLATVGGIDVGDVRLWDVATGEVIASWETHSEQTKAVAFSPDGRTLATGGGVWNGPGEVTLWNATTRKKNSSARIPEGGVLKLTFAPDGKTLAAGYGYARGDRYAGGLVFLDPGSGMDKGQSLAGHIGEVTAVAYSPDGSRLLTSTFFNDQQADRKMWELQSWDTQTGREPKVLESNREHADDATFFHLARLAVSRDGTRIAGGGRSGDEGLVKVFDAATGGTICRLDHKGTVWSLAFAPDNRTLATADSGTGAIRFWDVATSQELPALEAFPGAAFALTFSLDGKHLIAGGSNDSRSGIVKWWLRE